MYCDAHIHLGQCAEIFGAQEIYAGLEKEEELMLCSCAHSCDDFAKQKAAAKILSEQRNAFVVESYGFHPQNPDLCDSEFMCELLETGQISAIGESGFDFFTPEFKSQKQQQILAWEFSVKKALEYGVPLIIHDRKALDILFSYTRELSSLRSVVFHSFAFGVREASSLLSHGINSYFSFGSGIFRGNKKNISCVAELPADRILFETDAPFQTQRGEKYSKACVIKNVYETAASIRKCSLQEIQYVTEKNFCSAYNISRA